MFQNMSFDTVNASLNRGNNAKSVKVSTFEQKNYLNTRLERGQDKKEIVIRLIPIDKDANTPFVFIHQHNVSVPKKIAASGWKNYICPVKSTYDGKENNTKCPFCEINHMAFEHYEPYLKMRNQGVKDTDLTQEQIADRQKWLDLSLANKANEGVIFRCIERGHENEGPKFCKTGISASKKNDIYNQIYELAQSRLSDGVDVYDLLHGRDLKIIINAVYENNQWTNKVSFKVVDVARETPLSTDETLMEKWINDEKKWTDVFAIKPYEYLKIVSNGKIPYYDKEQNIWVEKEDTEDSNNGSISNDIERAEREINGFEEPINPATVVTPQMPNNNSDNDLPF